MRKYHGTPSQHMLEIGFVEPTNSIVRRPELAGLVDINLTGLLGIRLPEFLANSKGVEARFEDAPLTAEVRRATETKRSRKGDFGFVKQMAIWVVRQVERVVTRPISLERLRTSTQSLNWWTKVWQSVVVNIFGTLLARSSTFGRLRSTLGRVRHSMNPWRWLGCALDSLYWGGVDGLSDRLPWLLNGRSGCNMGMDLAFGTRRSADTLRLPVLILCLLACSLHVGSRILVVHTAQSRHARQSQHVFLASWSIQLVVKLMQMHCHMLRNQLLRNSPCRARGKERLLGQAARTIFT